MLSTVLAESSAQQMAVTRSDTGEFALLHRVKISDTRVLDVKAELAPDHENLNLRFSITVKVTQSL